MRVLWFTALVIIIDQATKMLVMKTMYLGEQIPLIGDWLKLTYTENPGMAFGITFGPRAMVTVFSVIATFLITLYLFKVRKGYLPYRTSLAFILGGALGNIIDRVFYGALFNGDSYFVGKVVDFIHVNVWSGFIPESIPVLGGTYLSLFPIWNVADMAIVCGVVGILYFQKRYHFEEHHAMMHESAEGAALGVPESGAEGTFVVADRAGDASPGPNVEKVGSDAAEQEATRPSGNVDVESERKQSQTSTETPTIPDAPRTGTDTI